MLYADGTAFFIGLMINNKEKQEFENLDAEFLESFSYDNKENLQMFTRDNEKFIGKVFEGKFQLSEIEDLFNHVKSKILLIIKDQRIEENLFMFPLRDNSIKDVMIE